MWDKKERDGVFQVKVKHQVFEHGNALEVVKASREEGWKGVWIQCVAYNMILRRRKRRGKKRKRESATVISI